MGLAPPPPSVNPVIPLLPLPTSGYYWVTGVFGLLDAGNWIGDTGGMYVNGGQNVNKTPRLIWRNANTNISFSKDKEYQYITKVSKFSNTGCSFSAETPWGANIIYDNVVDVNGYPLVLNLIPPSPGDGYLYFYSGPNENIQSRDVITYRANKNFGINNEKVDRTYINQIEFEINGFAWWRDANSGINSSNLGTLNSATDGKGWSYYQDSNSYIWYDDITGNIEPAYSLGIPPYNFITSENLPENNNISSRTIRPSKINYLSKFISDSVFNLSFTYNKLVGTYSEGISIYLSQEPPIRDSLNILFGQKVVPDGATLLATFTQSGSTYSYFFGLQGNQYLIITASQSTGMSVMGLTDIQINGSYWPGNNRRFITTDSATYSDPTLIRPSGLTGATFSQFSGTGNSVNATQSLDVQQLFSKIGNGKFVAGIWENGVWNSGWRDDTEVYEFYEIGLFYSYNKGKIWRFEIIGPISSVEQFEVGNKVSIGNIIAIDFNQERKLLKGYYSILAKSTSSIVVEVINNFPIERIEIDSPFHRIKITRNVWLSGIFLNGYFKGVWNSGLFKGYPLLTEMFDTHWIDGIFDGGHFKSQFYSVPFNNTYFVRGNKVGLSFSVPHKLYVDDIINIDKTDKDINPSYDGTYKVVSVPNEYEIITDIEFVSNYNGLESGIINTAISSGVVQNFDFNSKNISKNSSADYLDSDAVFIYNSWMDINYNNYSATNIGRPNTLRNNLSNKEFSQNNLYGYTTDDVLSSNSTFRNSFNLVENIYKLGTKYKIYNDYIGINSEFDTFFDPTNINPRDFLNLGWTYSASATNSIIFSRSGETRARNTSRPGYNTPWVVINDDMLVGSELQIDARSLGGVLNLSDPIEEVDFRFTDSIKRNRYTMVEFDLVRWNADTTTYISNDSKKKLGGSGAGSRTQPDLIQPVLHFDNINKIIREVDYGVTGVYQTTLPATYLPIYQNIDHLTSPVKKKSEYFYNKRNLSLNLTGCGFGGVGTASVLIDNLKFYEVDMIPFFQYFTERNINLSVAVPYQGVAPFIDYTDANFDFVDNTSIGLDSFAVQSSNVAIFGVGVGIGLGFAGRPGTNTSFAGDFSASDDSGVTETTFMD
jgi:hypothetical protein